MSQQTISGVMVNVHGLGILLRGPSGIGKSELALSLLDRGHQLISDDALQLERTGNQIIATAPEILRGRLNIRELGIINVEQFFGIGAVNKKQCVNLIIELLHSEPKQKLAPLPLEYTTQSLLGLDIPFIQLTCAPQRDLALLVETAAKQAIQREAGFNINQAFIAQANKNMGQPS